MKLGLGNQPFFFTQLLTTYRPVYINKIALNIIYMKKITLCLLSFLGLNTVLAQKVAEAPVDHRHTYDRIDMEHPKTTNHRSAHGVESVQASVVWSEDFANGIPMGWSQNGTPATALWEYRGPNTNPSNSVGSRGAFGNPNAVIVSNTTANGFIIFDSDYYDNGTSGTNGTVPAPHIGRLLTDTIDLSAEPFLELSFNGFMRNFFSNFYVAFSKDGGATFPDTVELYQDELINQRSDNPVAHAFNVSSYIGGESQAMMQFIFAGNRPGNNNGTGGYFWMIDDIELSVLPENELRFTALANAPAKDILFDGNPDHANYGNISFDQIVPISFDANALNYGSNTQTNVALEVEIFDANGSSVQILSSPAEPSVASEDTVDFSVLTTPSWTPAAPGRYTIVYRIVSDSLDAQSTTATDTLSFGVGDGTHTYSLDWGVVDNFFGQVPGNEVVAVATRYSLENEDPDSAGSGLVFIESLDIFMSLQTDSTADIEIVVYDTAGFVFNSGLPPNTPALFRKTFTLDQSRVGSLTSFLLGEEDSIYDNTTQTWSPQVRPLALPTGTYFFMINFFGNQTNSVFRFANNSTFSQPSSASVFQRPNGDWFGGILDSDEFEAPVLRLTMAEAPAFNIGLSELDPVGFEVYPNPSSGKGYIQFENGGSYQVKVFDLLGNEVKALDLKVNANTPVELDFSKESAGIYLISISGEGLDKAIKMVIH